MDFLNEEVNDKKFFTSPKTTTRRFARNDGNRFLSFSKQTENSFSFLPTQRKLEVKLCWRTF